MVGGKKVVCSTIDDRRDRSIKESPGTSKDNLQRPIENAVSA